MRAHVFPRPYDRCTIFIDTFVAISKHQDPGVGDAAQQSTHLDVAEIGSQRYFASSRRRSRTAAVDKAMGRHGQSHAGPVSSVDVDVNVNLRS